MRKSFWQYYWDSLHNFGEAVINVFIFLPYFFSVSALLKTLFYPLKNLIIKKTFVGFSFSDWANRFAFNIISRSMGATMRLGIIAFILFYKHCLWLYFLLLPYLLLFLRLFYLFSLTQKTTQEKKMFLKKKFIENHLLNNESLLQVEKWFEEYYKQHLRKATWWKLKNLFSYPPLARDWAVGYTPILDQYSTDLATSSYLHHIKNIIDRKKKLLKLNKF